MSRWTIVVDVEEEELRQSRDEEDEEIRKYTFDKDITELVIPKDHPQTLGR